MKASHIYWNLVGLGAPLLMALIFIPILIHNLGTERFGFLSLVWGALSYAGVLDLGIGRALTQVISSMIGATKNDQISVAYNSALKITFIASICGVSVLYMFYNLFGIEWLNIHNIDKAEIQYAILIFILALPAQSMSSTYRGVNDAFLNFKGTNVVRLILGIINFAGPGVISYYSNNLIVLVGCVVFSRLVSLIFFKILADQCMKGKDIAITKDSSNEMMVKLFKMGGWLTVSNLISPIMVQLPRFVIAALISTAAVTLYTVPFEMVSQSLVVVGAITTVFYPVLTQLIISNSNGWYNYFNKWLLRVSLMMLVVSSLMSILLPFFMPLWLGQSFNDRYVTIGQILCIGVFFNSIATVYYSALHSQGKVATTAKIHLLELPIFLISLYYLIEYYGVVGAALAWTGRMILDLILLMLSFYRGLKCIK